MTAYQVKLPVFEGPLDLLLHLIERRELDITEVSLAKVTDQYLEYLSLLEELSAEVLISFLVVAAKLLLIKSRALLPQPPFPAEEEEEDVSHELVQQLIEYKKFKAAAQELRTREEKGLRAYVRLAPAPKLERRLDLEGVSLNDLLEALQRALQIQAASPVSEMVAPFAISIADKMAEIEDLVTKKGHVSFQRVLTASDSRLEIIVAFLALLELIKQHKVTVRQERLFGEILILATIPSGS